VRAAIVSPLGSIFSRQTADASDAASKGQGIGIFAPMWQAIVRIAHIQAFSLKTPAIHIADANIKIMYLKDGEYHYPHLDHAPRKSGAWRFALATDGKASKSPVYGVYTANGYLPKDECAFCHMLVPGVNGKPGGVFFPRYQESFLASYYTLKSPESFDFKSFKIIETRSAPIALPTGLPDKLLFKQVSLAQAISPQDFAQLKMYARTLFESPEIFEAMARDNHASMCMSVDFGPQASHVFGHDTYVCADNVNRKLYVRYRNAMLSTGNGLIDYVIPYYNDAERTARSMRGAEKILGAGKAKSASGPTQDSYR
jgi:hypothetical protein